MKRNPMLNQRQLEQLQTEKSLSQLRVNEGVNLFIEEISDTDTSDTSKWEHEFDLDQNRLQVKFNQPQDNNTSEVSYNEFVIVDRRISVLDLKVQIAETLGQKLSILVFKRGGTHGAELIEDESTLKQAQFYNMICVQI